MNPSTLQATKYLSSLILCLLSERGALRKVPASQIISSWRCLQDWKSVISHSRLHFRFLRDVEALRRRPQRGTELGHLGVYPLDAVQACDGDAVVAIKDEVGVADLVEAHRREFHYPVEGSTYALPSQLRARPCGQERPVELRAPSDASHHVRRTHNSQASIDPTPRAEPPSGVI